MRNLFIVGDSFSWFYNGKAQWPLWTDQVGSYFKTNVVNASLNGCSQDWQWDQIKSFVDNDINNEDRLVVVLTSPMRFWLIENMPQISNPARATNLETVIENSDLRYSIKSFLGNIWRPELALKHQRQRLSEISYWVSQRSLARPLIIPAFYNPIDPEEWPHLNIANGNLYDDLQLKEFDSPNESDILDLWKGIECRHNHLCKSNHRVLAEAVSRALETDQTLDLISLEVHKGLITEDNHRSRQFAEQELDLEQFDSMIRETRPLFNRVVESVKNTFSPASPKRHLMVVGGGTSGLVTALTLKKLHSDLDVTMVESDRIGIVGVGEGSTEHWRWFMDVMGITTEEIIQKTGASFKFGINFLDWRHIGHRYMHVVSEAFSVDTPAGREMIHSYILANGGTNLDLIPKHCRENLHRWPFNDTQQFHFDTFKLNEFLHDLAHREGITIVKADIEHVNVKDKKVVNLVTKEGNQLSADYYIDSTGFHRLICEKALNSQWISYQQWLPVDRAIAWPRPHDNGSRLSWTTSRAMKNGWMWQIPVQARTGNGYVFSSSHCDSEQAVREVETQFGIKIESLAKDIRFEAGRLDQMVYDNVAAVGISSGFVEPLEASSIAMTIQQARKISQCLDGLFAADASTVKEVNDHMIDLQENALAFISLHYQTDRADTDFWKHVSKIDVPP